jgi:hypothetical protein
MKIKVMMAVMMSYLFSMASSLFRCSADIDSERERGKAEDD